VEGRTLVGQNPPPCLPRAITPVLAFLPLCIDRRRCVKFWWSTLSASILRYSYSLPPWLSHTFFWMIREGSSVDAPNSFEVSSSMHLGSAPRIPCPLRRFVPALFLLQTQAVLYYGLYHVDGRSDARYSGIHMPSLRYQLLSSPLCAFLGFLLLRHYVRICHDKISSLSECGVLYTGVEASRQLVMMQPWPPPPSCRSTHICRLSPPTYCRAAIWYPRRVFSACFSCGQAAQLWHS